MARSNITIVVNRTEAPVSYMYNGDIKELAPGENAIPEVEVEFAKTQNIVMGTEDPLNPAVYTSLIGRKGKDDCSAISFIQDENRQVHAMFEDGTSLPVGIERIDRRQLGEGLQGTIVKNRIPVRRHEVERAHFSDAAAGSVGG
jgi:hypothetical protein